LGEPAVGRFADRGGDRPAEFRACAMVAAQSLTPKETFQADRAPLGRTFVASLIPATAVPPPSPSVVYLDSSVSPAPWVSQPKTLL